MSTGPREVMLRQRRSLGVSLHVLLTQIVCLLMSDVPIHRRGSAAILLMRESRGQEAIFGDSEALADRLSSERTLHPH